MSAPTEVVYEMIRAGSDTVDDIVEIAGWPRQNVERAITQLGMDVGVDGKPCRRVATRPAAATPPPPQPNTPRPPDLRATTSTGCSHAATVAWAKGHPRAAVRAKGARFEALMLELLQLRRDLEAEDNARRLREHARRDALAEVERLKEQLRLASERARAAGVGKAKKSAGRNISPEGREAMRESGRKLAARRREQMAGNS